MEQGPGLSFWGLPSSLLGSSSTQLITRRETPVFQASFSSSYIVAFPMLSPEVAPSKLFEFLEYLFLFRTPFCNCLFSKPI